MLSFALALLFSSANIQAKENSADLALRYMSVEWTESNEVMNRLLASQPAGPEFVDVALRLIAQDESPWKNYWERRRMLLITVHRAIRSTLTWAGFEDGEARQSIHASAQKILRHFPNAGERQSDILLIYDTLDLWDETDIPFLIKKVFSMHASAPVYLAPLVKAMQNASSEQRELFAKRVRRARGLIEYALLYKTGLMENTDLLWMFRKFIEEAAFGRLGRGPVFDLERFEFPRLLFREDRSERNRETLSSLLVSVLKDVYRRVHEGDAPAAKALAAAGAKPGWAGRRFNPEQWERAERFLEEFVSGGLFTGCDEALRP